MESCSEPSRKKNKTEKVIIGFPVDFIKNYQDINNLKYETQPNGLGETSNRKVQCWVCYEEKIIEASHVRDFNIFGDDAYQTHGIVCNDEKPHFAGLEVAGRWWSIDEMLSSNNISRNGLMEVKTFGDRLVLSVLNTLVYNEHEKLADEPVFEPHPPNEAGKIMWQSGKAVGFYTIKKKGKLISHFSPEVWKMNVLDTIFVRRDFRSKGLATQMVEDFIDGFLGQDIGLSYPLTAPLKTICLKILGRRKEDRDRVWECRDPGGIHCSINLWRSLKAEKISEKTK